MCSYNLINGRWSCENNETLAVDFKQRIGFQGWVSVITTLVARNTQRNSNFSCHAHHTPFFSLMLLPPNPL